MIRLKPKTAYFLAFTGIFAVLAGFVFWGCWSCNYAPVMPDHPIVWPPDYGVRLGRWLEEFLRTGRFEPLELFNLVGSPYWWQEFKYAFCLYLSGLGMAYFLRGRGLSRFAAYSGGLLLAFCGYWCTLYSAGHYGWFQWMAYGVFAFGLADRALADGRLHHWILLGAALAWGSMHQPDLWMLFTAFTFVYFVCRWFALGRKLDWRGWCAGALSFLLVGAPGFLHAGTNDVAGRDRQIEESGQDRWTFVTNWSMPPEDTLEFFVPRIHGDTSCQYTIYYARKAGQDTAPYTGRLGRPMMPDGREAPRGNYRQHSLYVGYVTCILAAIGAVLGRKRKTVVFFALSALVFWLFSMGRYCEAVYRLVYALPMGDYLRAPVKWHHLTEFCLVVLAAHGIDALAKKFNRAYLWLALLVLWGAADLVRVDAKYCAPVWLGRQKQVLAASPEGSSVPPFKPDKAALALGVISLFTSIGAIGYGAFSATRRRHS